MPASVFYPVSGGGGSTSNSGTTDSGGTSRPYGQQGNRAFLGFGLLAPFQRDLKGDFAAGGDEALVLSCVGQVLGTRCSTPDGRHQGELPWRPEFGSLLYLLRYRNLDDTTTQLARVYAADALQRWEPRFKLRDVVILNEASIPNGSIDTLRTRVFGDVITANVAGNQVLIQNVSTDVQVQ